MTIIIDQKPKNVKNPTTQYIIVRKSQHKNKAIEKIDNNKLEVILFVHTFDVFMAKCFLKKHLISFSFTSFLISFAVPGILNEHGAKQKKRICTFSDSVLRGFTRH